MQNSKHWLYGCSMNLGEEQMNSENVSSIKKTLSKTKNTLVEIKNNLQGDSSTVDEAKNQVN